MLSIIGLAKNFIWVFPCVCVFSRSVMSDPLWPCESTPLGSSVHGVFPARLLKRIAFPPPGGSSQGSNPHLLLLLRCWRILCHWATREAWVFPLAGSEKNKWTFLPTHPEFHVKTCKRYVSSKEILLKHTILIFHLEKILWTLHMEFFLLLSVNTNISINVLCSDCENFYI